MNKVITWLFGGHMFKMIVSWIAMGIVCMVSLSAAAVESPLHAAFRQVEVVDAVTQAPFPVTLWYPTRVVAEVLRIGPYTMEVAKNGPIAEGVFALVIISHGSGGGNMNHRDLALHLARQGYIVAAPMHPGDNYKDTSGTGTREVWVGRPKQVSQTIDQLLADPVLGPHLRSDQIAVVGYSAGGYTALAVIGGKPSLRHLIRHCREHPEDTNFCAYGKTARQATQPTESFPALHDSRVKAAVLMVPVGALFEADALAAVHVPVRLYSAERDDILLPQYHVEHVRKNLPVPPEYVLVKNAGHFSFIAPFPEMLQKIVGPAAQDPEGFDRAFLHQQINVEIADFLSRVLQ